MNMIISNFNEVNAQLDHLKAQFTKLSLAMACAILFSCVSIVVLVLASSFGD